MAIVEKRPYRQTARAAASEALRKRIVQAFHDLLLTRWIDEATLDETAAMAGTTTRTVIRLFGGKEGLLEAVLLKLRDDAAPRRAVPPDAPLATSIEALLDHYEDVGDFVIRFLAQEERAPALRFALDFGRRVHREWVAERFGVPEMALNEHERERLVTRLVVATDLYTWKLLHRDFGCTREETARLMTEMIVALTNGRVR